MPGPLIHKVSLHRCCDAADIDMRIGSTTCSWRFCHGRQLVCSCILTTTCEESLGEENMLFDLLAAGRRELRQRSFLVVDRPGPVKPASIATLVRLRTGEDGRVATICTSIGKGSSQSTVRGRFSVQRSISSDYRRRSACKLQLLGWAVRSAIDCD